MQHSCVSMQHSRSSMQDSRICMQHSRISMQHSRISMQHSRISVQHSRISVQHRPFLCSTVAFLCSTDHFYAAQSHFHAAEVGLIGHRKNRMQQLMLLLIQAQHLLTNRNNVAWTTLLYPVFNNLLQLIIFWCVTDSIQIAEFAKCVGKTIQTNNAMHERKQL